MATTNYQPETVTLEVNREEWYFLLHAIHDARWEKGMERGVMLTEARHDAIRVHMMNRWHGTEIAIAQELERSDYVKYTAPGGTGQL